MEESAIKELKSGTSIKSVVDRHLMRAVLEALFEAECGHRDPISRSTEASTHLKVRTSLGSMRLRVRQNLEKTAYRSELLRGHRCRLAVPAANILVLPFIDELDLIKHLATIYQEMLPDRFVQDFRELLAARFEVDEKEPVAREYAGLYLGTLSLSRPAGCFAALELDYCIGVRHSGEVKVLGVWDPAEHAPERWVTIRENLKTRGLHRAQSIYTDNSAGLADAFLGMIAHQTTIYLTEEAPEEMPAPETIEAPPARFRFPMPRFAENRSFVSMTFSFAALGLLVLFGGFNNSIRAGSFSSPAPVLASNPSGHDTVPAPRAVTPVERELLNELEDPRKSADSLAALIKIASTSDNALVTRAIVRLREHPESLVRASVAKALAAQPQPSPAERKLALVVLLNDPDFLVRGFAAKALGRFDTPGAKQALRLRLETEDNEVVRALILRLLNQN